MTKQIRYIPLLLFLFLSFSFYGQTGPGGISNNNGADDLTLWLKSDKNISYNSSKRVNRWFDNSGYGHHFDSSSISPFYTQEALNGLPALEFNSDGAGLERTGFDISNMLSSDANTFIFVKQSTSGTSWFNISGATLSFNLSSSNSEFNYGSGILNGDSVIDDAYHILTGLKTSGGRQSIYIDGAYDGQQANSNSLTLGNDDVFLGSADGTASNGWQGNIAELLFFDRALDTTERLIIDNYLASKYDLSLPSNYDKYQGDLPGNGDFDFEVVGIGNANASAHSLSNSAGVRISDAGTTIDAGEFVFIGHDNTYNQVDTTELISGVEARWARNWFLDTTINSVDGIDLKISFDMSEGVNGSSPGDKNNYVLLFRNTTTGDFDSVAVSNRGIENDDQIYFEVANANLNEGYYTLGTTDKSNSPVGGGKTWYSYYEGDWSEWSHWTLDPDGSRLENPNRLTPGAADTVVILNGWQIDVNNSNKNVGALEVREGATLNLSATTGHDFGTISGAGKIKLASGNFPIGNATDFSNNGILEYTGSNYSVTDALDIKYMVVNLTASDDTLTLVDSVSIGEDLTIQNGAMKINNGSSTTRLNIAVGNDLQVSSSGAITVGRADAYQDNTDGTKGDYHQSYHTLEVYGNFVNEGIVKLTNLSGPDFDSRATNGAVSLVFKGESDNEFRCKDTTLLYNLVIDKGSDRTYNLNLHSNKIEYFGLFGENNNNWNRLNSDDPDPETQKALWIKDGTLRLTGNIFIPSLTEGNRDFTIGEDAALVLDGPGIEVNNTANDDSDFSSYPFNPQDYDNGRSNQGLYILGKLQVNDGLFWLGKAEAINFRDEAPGELVVKGGEVKTNQIGISSSATAGGIYAFYQSGGIVRLTGTYTPDGSRAMMHLAEPEMSFTQKGGTILLENVSGNNPNGIYIQSKEGNYAVSGGELEIDAGGNNAQINSTAPFYDFTVTNGDVAMQTPLKVLNNLTLQDNRTLTMNDNDLQVNGDFFLGTGASYVHGTNTTTFSGENNSNITIEDNSTPSAIDFDQITVNKAYDDLEVSFTSSGRSTDTSNAASVIADINSIFTVERGILDYSGFQLQMFGDTLINKGTIGKKSSSGRLVLTGSNTQYLEAPATGNAYFGHVEQENANGVFLIGDASFGQFTLIRGLMNIGKYLMSVDTSAIRGSGFDNAKMIKTAGNSSDKGLEYNFNINDFTIDDTLTYPFGTDPGSGNEYTPAFVIFQQDFASDDIGSYRINPVAEEHPATEEILGYPTDVIDYYWKTRASGFNSEYPDGLKLEFVHYEPMYRAYVFLLGYFYYHGYFTDDGNWIEDSRQIPDGTNRIIFDDDADEIGLTNEDYTAARTEAGTPFIFVETYYSRQNGNWDDPDTWSTTGHNGTSAGSTPYDEADFGIANVIIGGNDSVVINNNDQKASILKIKSGSVLDINSTTSHLITRIEGGGKFRTSTSNIPPADFGDFVSNDTAIFEYYGGSYNIDGYLDEYPNLWISGDGGTVKTLPAQDILVNQSLLAGDVANTGDVLQMSQDGDLEILDSLRFRNAGVLQFQSGGTGSNTVRVNKSIDMNYNGADDANSIEVETGASSENPHELIVFNDIITGNGTMNFWTGSANRAVDLYFRGDTNSVITRPASGTDNLALNHLYIEKDALSDTVFMNSDFTLTDNTEKALHLNTGTFRMNNSDIDISLSSDDGEFLISPTTEMIIDSGRAQVTGATGAIFLDGKLVLNDNGELSLDDGSSDNYIEYSSSDNAVIEVHDNATLTVGSQLRRGVVNSSGVLNYRQTGGTVILGKNVAPEGSRGVLEVLNNGSEFKHTGGDLIISQGQASASVAAVNLDPETTNISDTSVLQLGDGNTPGSTTIGLNSTVSLSNLLVDNTSGYDPTVELMINALTLTGGLELENNTTFDANDQNVTLAGDFINNGTYQPGTNTTKFNGAKQRLLGDTEFYDMVVNSSDSLLLSGSTPTNLTVTDSLSINSAVLVDSANIITMEGSVHNSGTHVSTGSSGGMILNGNEAFNISGGGTFGRVELDNPEGVTLTNNMIIQDNLNLTEGVFRIREYRLTLNGILEDSNFGSDKMIQTSGASSNSGFRYTIPSGSGNYTVPIGSPLEYTPVDLNVSANPSASQITFKPDNNPHPTISAKDSVLQYYWELESSNVDNMDLSFVFHYEQSDVPTPYGSIELDYIPAYLYNAEWRKFSPAGVNNFENEIYFDFTGVDNLTGEYTAGHPDAIPDSVPEFTSVKNGKWNEPNTWQREGEENPGDNVPSDGPNGFIVNIEDSVRVPLTPEYFSVEAYETNLRPGGVLDLRDTYGHYLGEVTGTGGLAIGLGKLPAGEYDEFFTCSGGALEYKGDGDYTISSVHDTLRILRFSGTGTRTLPLNDLVICDSLVINGPTLDNSTSDNKLTLLGTFARFNGVFDAGDASSAIVEFSGASQQSIPTSFTGENAFYNLTLDNSNGLLLTDSVDIDNQLNLNNGIIYTADTSVLYLNNTNNNVVTGASSSNYIDGPLDKLIIDNGNFDFPVGNDGKVGWIDIYNTNTTSSQRWQAQYYNQNPYDGGYWPDSTGSGIAAVSLEEYWRVKSPAGDESNVRIYWDSQSQIGNLTSSPGTELRIAEWDNSLIEWIDAGDNVNTTDQTAATNSPRTLDEHAYTFASIDYAKPTVDLEAIQADICEGDSAILRFELTGESPWDTLIYHHPAAGNDTLLQIDSSVTTIDTLTTPGQYWAVKLVYNNGQVATDLGDTVEVTTSPLPSPVIDGSIEACENSSAYTYSTLAAENPDHYYNWSVTAQGNIVSESGDQAQVEWINFGSATLTVTEGVVNVSGCESTTDTLVEVYETPDPNVTATPLEACYPDTIDLQAGDAPTGPDAFNYTWSPDSVNNVSAENTYFAPTGNLDVTSETINFKVIIENVVNNSCSDADSIDVTIYRKPETGDQYYVPSDFDQ